MAATLFHSLGRQPLAQRTVLSRASRIEALDTLPPPGRGRDEPGTAASDAAHSMEKRRGSARSVGTNTPSEVPRHDAPKGGARASP